MRTNLLTCIVLILCALAVSPMASAVEDVYTTYYHNDVLGSPVAASDESANVLWRSSYYPFGGRRSEPLASRGNKIWYTGKPQDASGLLYMGARYYEPTLGRFMATDPMEFDGENPRSFNRYAYANNNPYRYVDPDGNSPISVLAKQAAKVGVKEALQKMAKRQVRRLGRYMSDTQRKQMVADFGDVISTLDSSPAEIAIEFIPILGDIYGGTKFVKGVNEAYSKMQLLENAWVRRIYDSLPSEAEKKKFKKAMRNAGVRDAKQDQGIARTGSGKEMHHNTMVQDDIGRASDPTHIEALDPAEHAARHREMRGGGNRQ